jgi:hypothetical protein
MSLGSHESRNSASSLHWSRARYMIAIHPSLGTPSWEHRKKGSDPLGGSWSKMWVWLEDERVKMKGLMHV